MGSFSLPYSSYLCFKKYQVWRHSARHCSPPWCLRDHAEVLDPHFTRGPGYKCTGGAQRQGFQSPPSHDCVTVPQERKSFGVWVCVARLKLCWWSWQDPGALCWEPSRAVLVKRMWPMEEAPCSQGNNSPIDPLGWREGAASEGRGSVLLPGQSGLETMQRRRCPFLRLDTV